MYVVGMPGTCRDAWPSPKASCGLSIENPSGMVARRRPMSIAAKPAFARGFVNPQMRRVALGMLPPLTFEGRLTRPNNYTLLPGRCRCKPGVSPRIRSEGDLDGPPRGRTAGRCIIRVRGGTPHQADGHAANELIAL